MSEQQNSYFQGYCVCRHHDRDHDDRDDACLECECRRFLLAKGTP